MEQAKMDRLAAADALERFMGSEALLTRFLGRFLEDGNMDALRAAVAAGEWDKALTASHTLKGMSGNLSMTVLYDLFTGRGRRPDARHRGGLSESRRGHPGDVNMAGPKKGRWLALWKKLRYYIAATAVLVGAGIGFFLFLRRILLVNGRGPRHLQGPDRDGGGRRRRPHRGRGARRRAGTLDQPLQRPPAEDLRGGYGGRLRRLRPADPGGQPLGRGRQLRLRLDLRPGCADGGPAVRPQRYRGGL